jgi:hypothetical protein
MSFWGYEVVRKIPWFIRIYWSPDCERNGYPVLASWIGVGYLSFRIRVSNAMVCSPDRLLRNQERAGNRRIGYEVTKRAGNQTSAAGFADVTMIQSNRRLK